MLRFEAFKQKFSIAKKCLNVRNIECETNSADDDPLPTYETKKQFVLALYFVGV